MSSLGRIAAVTATLTNWLQDAVLSSLSGTVTATSIDKLVPTTDQLNLHLFHVSFNPGYRNRDQAARRSDGSLVERPTTAVDLHYLITFTGVDDVTPQLMLAQFLRVVQAQPQLTKKKIVDVCKNSKVKAVKESNLASQIDSIKLTPTNLTIEERSRLWSLFPGKQHLLSVVYVASTVVLEADFDPEPSMPVLRPAVGAGVFSAPQLSSAQIVGEPGSEKLVISGVGLSKDVVVTVDGFPPIKSGIAVQGDQINVNLPAGIGYGVDSVTVTQEMEAGGRKWPVESDPVPFLFRPVIKTATVTATDIEVEFARTVGKSQKVAFIIQKLDGGPQIRMTVPVRGADATKLSIPTAGKPKGNFVLRVRVDQAESIIQVVAGKPWPTVEVK
ncbi:MAG: DUF4255 domain-containing protein [Fimbriimonas sp.]